MRLCRAPHRVSPTSFNSVIQEHECKILFIIWHLNRILLANFAIKRCDFGFRKRDVFMDVHAERRNFIFNPLSDAMSSDKEVTKLIVLIYFRELRDMLMPEIKDLIIKHRFNYLEGGTRFPKYDTRGNRARSMYNLNQSTKKPTKSHELPAKTQISRRSR